MVVTMVLTLTADSVILKGEYHSTAWVMVLVLVLLKQEYGFTVDLMMILKKDPLYLLCVLC